MADQGLQRAELQAWEAVEEKMRASSGTSSFAQGLGEARLGCMWASWKARFLRHSRARCAEPRLTSCGSSSRG